MADFIAKSKRNSKQAWDALEKEGTPWRSPRAMTDVGPTAVDIGIAEQKNKTENQREGGQTLAQPR